MELESKRRLRRHYYHLKAREVDKIKGKLLSEKDRIQGKEVDSSDFCLKREELSDPIDEACANIQASQELRFKTRESKYLQKIEKQLLRVSDPEFGECEECGEAIGFERLMARPTAEKCIGCKEVAESDEKGNFFQRRSKSLGRTMRELVK